MISKPNIVIIVMDTARADNFSCYGYNKTTSHYIDSIAGEGILFANAISSSPWTLPSHVSLFTGLYPSQHGLTEDNILMGNNIYGLSKKHTFPHFLPTLLKKEGYRTVGFSNNPWVSHNFGFDKGFDFFYEAWKNGKKHPIIKKLGRKVRKMAPQKFQPVFDNLKVRLSSFYHSDSGAEQTLAVMKEWFRKNYSPVMPFFVFFNFMEPHLPYMPPKPCDSMFMEKGYNGRRIRRTNQDPFKFIAKKAEMGPDDFAILRSLYDGEIAYLDSEVKGICDYLKDLGMLDQTFLIITSDHGENIGEHELMGHQFCLYDTLLRVPLIIRFPELGFKGKVEHKHIQLSDIFYTVLDVVSLRLEGQAVRKRSLLNPDYAEQIFAEHELPKITLACLSKRFPRMRMERLEQKLRCIYADGMKYIWNSREPDELYDIMKDPHEKTNLCKKNPERASKYLNLLKKQRESLVRDKGNTAGKFKEYDREQMDSEIREKLRELGYI